jgi:hypothetical protein
MARTPLTITDSSKAGTTLPAGTAADVVNGNSVVNDGRTLVIAANAGATPRTVTITPTATVDGLTAAARTVALPATTTKLLGPYDIGSYSTVLQISGDHADVKFQPIRGTAV